MMTLTIKQKVKFDSFSNGELYGWFCGWKSKGVAFIQLTNGNGVWPVSTDKITKLKDFPPGHLKSVQQRQVKVETVEVESNYAIPPRVLEQREFVPTGRPYWETDAEEIEQMLGYHNGRS